MGEPVVANGVPVTMTLGSSSKTSVFSQGSPHVRAGGYPVVTTQSLLGGLTFVASLLTTKVTVDGVPAVLVGATVTDSAGYTGVLAPAHGAGLKFNLV